MTLAVWLLAAATGALLVGMIGTGSSLVIMPTLALTLPPLVGDDKAVALRLAAGTTMAVMTAGAIAAAYSQARAGRVDARLLRYTVAPYMAGALLGPWLASRLPGAVLQAYLAALLVGVALRLLWPERAAPAAPAGARDYRNHRVELSLVLLLIGLACSVAGVASGLFAIPYLCARFGLPLRTVIGTSTGAAALYSLFGSCGYIASGWRAAGLPPYALGYVYLPALLPMTLAVSVCAPLGVKLASFFSETLLKRGFAVFLLLAACAIIWI